MLDHHIQRSIIHQLAFTPTASFTELKPGNLDNKLFTYHLKKTIVAGYVSKNSEGLYVLTQDGRRLSTGVLDKQKELVVERPLSALFLIIRRKKDGAWLLYKRITHPMLGYSGFMHCRPNATNNIKQLAHDECMEKTGLSGDFTALGGGYVRIFEKGQLESFTHFTLLFCDDVQGELIPNDTHAEYFWVTEPDFNDSTMFPTTSYLNECYQKRKPFFMDKTFTV